MPATRSGTRTGTPPNTCSTTGGTTKTYSTRPHRGFRGPISNKKDYETGSFKDQSSFLLNNTNYLRLKNLEIGYSLPGRWLSKVKIEKLRIYVNGSNLFSIDNLHDKGLDPEQGVSSGLNYPIHRVYTIGANLVF